jgi:hypothetical protein
MVGFYRSLTFAGVRRRVVAACVVVGALLVSRAHAICGAPPSATLSLDRLTLVPLNAHVWVRVNREAWAGGLCAPAPCAQAELVLEVRAVSAKGSATAGIKTTVRESSSGTFATFELVPASRLMPRVAYEVWAVDRKRVAPSTKVGVFVAGDAPDTTPPTWKGLVSARLEPAPGARRVGKVVQVPDECGAAVLTVTAERPVDERTEPGALYFGVWVADEGGRIDYAAPPLVYARNPDFHERYSTLLLGNRPYDEFSDFEPPIAGAPRIGVRVVDLAGNWSAPSEVSLRESAPGVLPPAASMAVDVAGVPRGSAVADGLSTALQGIVKGCSRWYPFERKGAFRLEVGLGPAVDAQVRITEASVAAPTGGASRELADCVRRNVVGVAVPEPAAKSSKVKADLRLSPPRTP